MACNVTIFYSSLGIDCKNCQLLLLFLLCTYYLLNIIMGFPGGSDSKESTCNTGDLGLITGLTDP